MEWYSQNMFSSMVAETVNAADPAAKESYELAKKYNITPPEVDKIRKKFVEFDLDGSGKIEYAEFMQMLCYVLRAKNPADVSRAVLMTQGCVVGCWYQQTWNGSFSAVSKPNFATKY